MCCNGHRKALEAKAALYDRLCEGEGLRRGGSDDSEGEEEEEGRYMVDFTRKIAEEVNHECSLYWHVSVFVLRCNVLPGKVLENKMPGSYSTSHHWRNDKTFPLAFLCTCT